MVASRAVEQSTSERFKRHSLLQALHRRGTSSRLQLARELRISNSRVCDLVEGMVDEGLLCEEQASAQRRGRRGVDVRLNPGFGHMLGFDMEAKRLRLVVTDFAGQIVWQTRKSVRRPRNRQMFLDQILSFIDSALKVVKAKFPRLLGIGLAASGVIDPNRGVILHYDMVPQAVNLPLRDLIREQVKLPCVMENNIRAMTLAEWTIGAAKGLRTFACMAVRSGVGAGIVIDGRLIAGEHGFCGETGYMVIPTSAPVSRWKSLQQTVSETALGLDVESSGYEISESVARRSGDILGSRSPRWPRCSIRRRLCWPVECSARTASSGRTSCGRIARRHSPSWCRKCRCCRRSSGLSRRHRGLRIDVFTNSSPSSEARVEPCP